MTSPTILLSGMIASVPGQGGAVWAVLQHLLGLRRLGYRVLFVEAIEHGSLRPRGAPLDASENARYFADVVRRFDLEGNAVLMLAGSNECVGANFDELLRRARASQALWNLSGLLRDDRLIGRIPIRVYLDLDPVFTQLWAADGIEMGFDQHTHFLTVGPLLGSSECAIPVGDRDWIGFLPPVEMSHWQVAMHPPREAFTTIANWRGYGSVTLDGVHFGQKAHSLRPLLDLPRHVARPLELALAIHPDEVEDLRAIDAAGWTRVDPTEVAATPDAYQTYVADSRAEFGLAKSGYVHARCGWFSDRSACYLASGRPVLAQDTGFSRLLPTGAGLLAFDDLEGAAEGAARIEADYAAHCRAARDLAERHLAAEIVLPPLLRDVGLEVP